MNKYIKIINKNDSSTIASEQYSEYLKSVCLCESKD